MILHCTQKLTKKLSEVSPTPLAEVSQLGSWHAHLYNIDHRQCVIFCHDASRYILFLPGLRKDHFADLGSMLRDYFLASLATLGVKGVPLHRVAMALGPVQFDRNTNQSVLASLRVASSDLSWMLEDINVMDCDPLALSMRLNDRPVTIKGNWNFSGKVMLSLVEHLK